MQAVVHIMDYAITSPQRARTYITASKQRQAYISVSGIDRHERFDGHVWALGLDKLTEPTQHETITNSVGHYQQPK